MKHLRLWLAIAGLFYCSVASAQNAGTVPSHAFAVGKGPGTQGFSSILCTSAQIALGQSAADPICRTLTGDVTVNASGVTAIGANKVTLGMHAALAADSFIGNLSGSSATPAANAFPNCTGALIYNTSTHVLGCNNSAGTGTVTSVTCGTGLSGGTFSTTGTCTLAFNSAVLQASPSNPTSGSTNTTTGVMMGLGGTCKLTPIYSTRVRFEIVGSLTNTGANGTFVQMAFGAGTAPSNTGAAAGTSLGSQVGFNPSTGGNLSPFAISGIATALTPGTAYWFDVNLLVGSGTGTISRLSCSASEVM